MWGFVFTNCIYDSTPLFWTNICYYRLIIETKITHHDDFRSVIGNNNFDTRTIGGVQLVDVQPCVYCRFHCLFRSKIIFHMKISADKSLRVNFRYVTSGNLPGISLNIRPFWRLFWLFYKHNRSEPRVTSTNEVSDVLAVTVNGLKSLWSDFGD